LWKILFFEERRDLHFSFDKKNGYLIEDNRERLVKVCPFLFVGEDKIVKTGQEKSFFKKKRGKNFC